MLIIAVPYPLSKKLDANSEEPIKMYDIICSKFDKKGNNKLENLRKEIDNCNTKNTNMEPYV